MKRFVDTLVRDSKLQQHVVYQGLATGSPILTARPETGWPVGATDALGSLGIPELYTHQARALDESARGKNVLLATPTASGKTLAYLLAFLARRAAEPDARGLFIYPLKALARDQLKTIQAFMAPLGLDPREAVAVYDGDTPEGERRKIRKKPPAILITNPDMLHMGILPSHETWAPYLSDLRLIVIDEAHVYRGIFGAHVHHVLRRALRLARGHGGRPQILAGSATIGEPRDFIETLTGEPFTVVRESGAPAAPRHVLFLAPDTASPYTIATHAVARAVSEGHKTIAFTKARRITELMHRWLRESWPELSPRVASYRAGYLPEERRAIEKRLFSGQIHGVISTSALEAGIDVGGLDVCVLVGYPGSLATSWQRIGRTGRMDRESLAILIAMPDALDRYVVRHPQHFFSGEFERVVLDPGNDTIADQHLRAAAAERSLDPEDVRELAGEQGLDRVERLVEKGWLTEVHDEQRWFTLRRKPQRDLPLRSAGTTYSLVRASDRRFLGTMDEARAWFEGHPGAIYLHSGQTYKVLDMDHEERTILLENAEVEYFTQVYARKETEILERFAERQLGPTRLSWGRVRVTTFIEGFAKKRIFGQEEISRHPLEDAPPQVLETVSFWIEFPNETLARLIDRERHPVGSLHAMEHATIGLFPLLAICDRWDLGGISYARHPQLDVPAVFVYDGWPGGVGLARTGFLRAEELLEKTRALVDECECEDGCPGCVHSPKCGSGNHPLDKAGSLDVFDMISGALEIGSPEASRDQVDEALSTHRSSRHGGVRGGGRLPEDFFCNDATEPGASPGAPAVVVPVEDARPVTLAEANWPEELPTPDELLEGKERWLFFDVETLRSAEDVGGWHRIDAMGMALAVVLDSKTGLFETYDETEVESLAERLVAADRVVGFNVDRFDLTVLSGYVGERVKEIATLDLLRVVKSRIGIRLGLGHLVTETLGGAKTADGLQSLQWIKEGRFDLVEKYCRSDVMLTAALWAHGRSKGFVLFRTKDDQRGRIRVRW